MQRVKFNLSNPNLRVIPSSFTIDDLINPQIITIYCDDDLQEDESIDVLFSEKKLLVGKLNVMRNINSDKNIVNFRVVYVKKKSVENDFKNIEEKIAKIGGYQAIEEYLNKKVLNQALIQCKIYPEDPQFGKLDGLDFSDNSLKQVNIINDNGELKDGALNYFQEQFEKLYPIPAKRRGIFIFLTSFRSIDANGIGVTYPRDANSLIIYSEGLDKKEVYAHEIGHILGLLHSFLNRDSNCNLINIDREIVEAKNIIEEDKAKLRIQNLRLNENIEYEKKYGSTFAVKKNIKILNQNIQEIKKDIKNKIDKIEVLKENKIFFEQGRTENIMDYTWSEECFISKKYVKNPSKQKTFSKLQWEIMLKELQKYYL